MLEEAARESAVPAGVRKHDAGGPDGGFLHRSLRSSVSAVYEGRAGVKPSFGHHLLAAMDEGPEPGSRWSAPRTNDLDAGEDRRVMDPWSCGRCIRKGR